MLTMPSFDDAVVSFQDFLRKNGCGTHIHWVCRPDIILRDSIIYIRQPLPKANESVMRSQYKLGCQNEFGVSIEMVCLLSQRPCCFVAIPADACEAEYEMIAGLKLSMPKEPKDGLPMTRWQQWRWSTKAEPQAERDWLGRLPQRAA